MSQDKKSTMDGLLNRKIIKIKKLFVAVFKSLRKQSLGVKSKKTPFNEKTIEYLYNYEEGGISYIDNNNQDTNAKGSASSNLSDKIKEIAESDQDHSIKISKLRQMLEYRFMFDGAAVETVDIANDVSEDEHSDILKALSENEKADAADSVYELFGQSNINLDKDYSVYEEVVIIDARLRDSYQLITEISRKASVEYLGIDENGVTEITSLLEKYDNLSALHIITHGQQAELRLGNMILNQDNIDNYQGSLEKWGEALSASGDILFYGCNVAEGEKGLEFINKIRTFTGADVAASTDDTGSPLLGGDSELEYNLDVDVEEIISFDSYEYLLAPPDLYFIDFSLEQTLNGEASGDGFGYDVAFSGDGSTVIVGGIGNDGGGTSSGHARIFSFDGTSWSQVGADIDGSAGDQAGGSVAISEDGTTVAIFSSYGSASSNGVVKTYDWDGTTWNRRTDNIASTTNGTNANANVISLSNDGLTIAVGEVKWSDGLPASEQDGRVRIFDWNTGTTSWDLRGTQIETASFSDDWFGRIALSGDGDTIVVGAAAFGTERGRMRIYGWDGTDWSLKGSGASSIPGEADYDRFGRGLAVNDDGTRVAVGARYSGTDRGKVYIYDYNSGSDSWSETATILGKANNDVFGVGLGFNRDGTRLIIGATEATNSEEGYAQIYDYDGTSWTQIGVDINGDANDDRFGYAVSMSDDGSKVIIGAYSGNYVKVYNLVTDTVTLSYTENDSATVIYDEFSIYDVDDTNIDSATVTMTNYVSAEDVIGYSAVTGITVDATTAGMLLLSGSTALADYEAFFAGVTYQNTSDDPSTTARTVTYVVNDGDGNSNTITATINITATNDAPSASDNTITTNEDTPYTFSASDFNFSDVDSADSLASIKVTSLETVGDLELSGAAVTLNQVIAVADITGGALVFSSVQHANGTDYDSFNFSVNDGTVDSASSYTMTVDVTAVNDAPAGSDNTLTILEDASHTFISSDFGFSDPNDSPADSFNSVIITTVPSIGNLELSSVAVTAGQEVLVSDLANLIYSPVANANGTSYSSFTFQVKDDGGTSNGGVDTDQSANTITFDVTAVNDVSELGFINFQQLGGDIDGEAAGDEFGFSTAVSADGTIVAVGAYKNDGTGADAGHTRLYQWDGTSWNQLGTDIDGEATGDKSGYSVELSEDGLTVAIGAIKNADGGASSGHVRVYDYNGTDWIQRGNDIDGENNGGDFGSSVSLSSNGLTVAAGAPFSTGSDYGYVKVYDWNGTAWSQRGLNIEGDTASDELGRDVKLSADGQTLVIGARGSSGADRVEIYDWNGTAWSQRSTDITGGAGAERFGFSVSASSDGDRIAIGAPHADDNGTDSGRVEIYDWNGTAWVQAGSDLIGASGDQFGTKVSLSADGQRLAIGAPLNDAGGADAGSVSIYDWNDTTSDWELVGSSILGEAADDRLDRVALNSNGNILVVGARLNDGVNGADSGHVRVYQLTSTAETLAYTENNPATVIYSEFSIMDVDDINIENATVQMTNFMAAEDVIGYSAVTGITVDTTTAGMLKLTGSRSLSDYETFFAGVTYQNTSDDPNTTARTVTYVVNDGDGASNTITATINITAVNDAPEGSDNTLTILEDASHTFVSGDFGFSDPSESDSFNSVIITSLPLVGDLELSSVAVTAGQEVLVSDLANLIYSPVADANGTSYSSFTFQVKDDGGTANGGIDTDQSANTITFNVTAVNDAPEGTDNTLTILEDASHTFVAGDFGFSDPNDSPADSFNSVIITTIPSAGSLELSSVAVTAGQEILVSDLANLIYSPVADANGTSYSSFTFQVKDDGGTSNGGEDTDQSANTITFDVTAINDEPSASDNTITTNEDTPYTFSASDFNFSDVDGDSLASVEITSLETAGDLELNGTDVTTNQVIAVADITNGLLVFSSALNANGASYDSFNFSVNDGVADSLASYTMTVDVTAVNDEPSASDNTITTNEDTPYTFSASDFNFSDVDGDSLASVEITSLETVGDLKLNGTDVTLNQVIAVADITSGLLVFSSALNANGTSYDSFNFSVNDGVADSLASYTMTVDVTAVNDEPSATDNTITTNEDTPYTFSASDFNFTDVDGDSLVSVEITSLETVGDLKLNGTDVTLNQVIAVADITNGLLVFNSVSNANGAGYDSFNFIVNDGTADSLASYTMTVDVTAVNDEPSASDNTITTNEDTPYTFSASDFNFSDVDGDSLVSVEITSLETVGDLALSGSAVTLSQVITVAEITGGSLVFSPVLNANGASYDSFNFSVNDGTADSLASYTMTVDVTAVNDAPDLRFADFEQFGNDVLGENVDDQFGQTAVLNEDGSILAVGSRFYNNTGYVQVYVRNGDSWEQLGGDINGAASGDNFSGLGGAVSLSADGMTIAIGAYTNDTAGSNRGQVTVYQYNAIGDSWDLVGNAINGEANNDRSGYSVSLNSDGTRVAIGATQNDGNGSNSGHVRVYDLVGGTLWQQVGVDIDGEVAGDQSGTSVSLSSDGTRVAIGAIYNDGNGSNSGQVRIYDWNGTAWQQVGSDIDGAVAGDAFGWSVDLSSDGSRVIIGAGSNDEFGSASGEAQVYDFNGTNWVQAGQDINGRTTFDFLGQSVSISGDGLTIAVGGESYQSSGYAQIYDWDATSSLWVQRGLDIYGSEGEWIGVSISLSGDGHYVAVGAPYPNVGSGFVRTYDVTTYVTEKTITYTENDPATVVSEEFIITDVDDTNVESATVTITSFMSGEDVIGYSAVTGITVDATTAGMLLLSGSASLSDYETFFEGVTYQNTSDDPDTTARTVTYVVNDGDDNSNIITATINITAVNDAPDITIGGGSAAESLTETDTTLSTSGTLVATDVDLTDVVT
ncbi:DUF4347 domain-containing protein, partial [Thiotrichales bacterium 19S9-11]|nr:DUF4347 domain-containing protein [Thiotrichales bacterium 19S9-11]